MAESSKLRDLRVHNVRLHHGRKPQVVGTLTVTRHHLTFSHPLDDDTRSGSEARVQPSHHVPSSSAASSTLSHGSTTDNEKRAGRTPDTQSKQRHPRQKPRTKTIWVPFPMIQHCVLRPSYLQSSTSRPQAHSDSSNAPDPDDSFPPTFGSSTYGRPSTDSSTFAQSIYGRPSTESTNLAPYASPRRSISPAATARDAAPYEDNGRSPALRVRCRDFQMMAFHFLQSSEDKAPDETARQVFFALRSRCCVEKVEDMLAFHFQPPPEEVKAGEPAYDARREFARMGIGGKAAEGPGNAWRITDINKDYTFSATYPSVLCVPQAVSDNMLKYGGVFRSRSRIPALSYLHFNGGSITRSSQPLIGFQGKRNPQDERLVSAIFSSHTPPPMSPEGSPPQLPSLTSPSTTTLESDSSEPVTLDASGAGLPSGHSDTALDDQSLDNTLPTTVRQKVYGSTRRNLIVDARPKLNALANRATGGGIEDVSNYSGTGEVPVEKVFLNIQNIHVMRSSLEKVVDSFANSDYLNLAPNQELLRKSGWLGHVAGLIEGSELVARAVGLTGSHVLIHCSDGWDRTAQVSALAQIMLDPYYRTLNGFITLVQKDFLAFGHKFRHRNGILGSEKWFEIENERIAPSRQQEHAGSDSNSLFGSKALSGAKSWFEKNRTSIFRQQNGSLDNLADGAASRPASPPPNPIIHSTPPANGKDDKEHKTSEKEIAPIFHQFLEAVWQMQRHYPEAFEFNERFLLRLLYQTYAGQYGEFLFNCEKERWQHRDQTPSVWPYFLARRAEFTSFEYTASAHDSLLLPKRGADQRIEVLWWSKLFGREDKEMNVPRALAPADPPSLSVQASSVSSDDGATNGDETHNGTVANGSALREAKSTASFGSMKDRLGTSFSTLSMQESVDKDAASASVIHRPQLSHQETDLEVLSKYASSSLPAPKTEHESQAQEQKQAEQILEDDDPLGVTRSMAQTQETPRMDFSAFAAQNAYQDR